MWYFTEMVFCTRKWEQDRKTVSESLLHLRDYPEKYFVRAPARGASGHTHICSGSPRHTHTRSGNRHTLREPQSDLHTLGVIITHTLQEPRSHTQTRGDRHTHSECLGHTLDTQVTLIHAWGALVTLTLRVIVTHMLREPCSHSHTLGRPGHTHILRVPHHTPTLFGRSVTLTHIRGARSHTHTCLGHPGHTHTHSGTRVTLTLSGCLITHTLRVMSYTHTQGPWSHSHTFRDPGHTHTHTHTHTLSPLCFPSLCKHKASLFKAQRLLNTVDVGTRGHALRGDRLSCQATPALVTSSGSCGAVCDYGVCWGMVCVTPGPHVTLGLSM